VLVGFIYDEHNGSCAALVVRDRVNETIREWSATARDQCRWVKSGVVLVLDLVRVELVACGMHYYTVYSRLLCNNIVMICCMLVEYIKIV
jgi:hypothetical protein